MRWSVLVVAASLICAGCATRFGETHYFKSIDEAGEPINYFRLKVGGGVFLSSARYVSGFYDERALDLYFGESISQPEGGKIPKAPGAELVSLGPNEGGKFLMILSSNSDAIAGQIGQLAENQEIATTLARLIRRDAILGAGGAQMDLSLEKARGRIAAQLGDSLIMNVDADQVSEDELEARVLQYTNVLAQALGAKQTFENLAALELWVNQQRSTLGRTIR